MSNLVPSDPDDQARLVGVFLSIIEDSLHAAQVITSRAEQFCDGHPLIFLFANLERAISDFRSDNPALKAVKTAAIPPSMLNPTSPKEGKFVA